jgi:hypothetical protein
MYVCGRNGPVHIHYVVQPALPNVVSEFGVYGPRMQAAMFAQGGSVDPHDAEAFADAARAWFSRKGARGQGPD